MVKWPQRGEHHPFIRLAQRKLTQLGYVTPETGVYDDATTRAIRQLAQTYHLSEEADQIGRVWLVLWRESGKQPLVKERNIS